MSSRCLGCGQLHFGPRCLPSTPKRNPSAVKDVDALRLAFLKLLKAVADHPDSMFDGAPLNAAFIAGSDALRAFDGPPPELPPESVTYGSIVIEEKKQQPWPPLPVPGGWR